MRYTSLLGAYVYLSYSITNLQQNAPKYVRIPKEEFRKEEKHVYFD